MIPKILSDISLVDLQSLIVNAVAEGRTIEYKRALNTATSDEKKEFLKDISSFANSSGGDILFGITEAKGLPVEILGIDLTDPDAEILRLENIIRDGLEPRIQADFRLVATDSTRKVLIIRVKKSFLSPHRVVYGGHDKFYSRNSKGAYALDTFELKTAFNMSDTLAERITNFKAARISDIESGNLPLPSRKIPRVALHLIPLNFASSRNLDVLNVFPAEMQFPGSSPSKNIINFEGKLLFSGDYTGNLFEYVQLYRTGVIESVQPVSSDEQAKVIRLDYIDNFAHFGIMHYFKFLQKFGIAEPIVVSLALLNVAGYRIPEGRYPLPGKCEFTKNNYILPELMLDVAEPNLDDKIRPLLDLIWNAVGIPKSPCFNETGKWKTPV